MSFLYKNDRIVNEGTHPESGNPVRTVELRPRELPPLMDEQGNVHEFWKSPENLIRALAPEVGRKVRTTSKGHQVLDIFATGVQGDRAPDGRNYPSKRIGTLFYGVKHRQDAETGEVIETAWHSYVPEGEKSSAPSPQAPATTPTTGEPDSSESEDTSEATDAADKATDEVASL